VGSVATSARSQRTLTSGLRRLSKGQLRRQCTKSLRSSPLRGGKSREAGSPVERTALEATFDEAHADFEAAWRVFLSKRTEADFQEWRDQRDWTARKYAMWEAHGKESGLTPIKG
jgi:hypothetical protein